MKKFCLSFLFSFFICLLIAQNCPPGDLIFERQSQIDSFAILYPNCDRALGSLIIRPASSETDDITNLEPLSKLEMVNFALVISGTSKLTNLNGLNNLSGRIGTSLEVFRNSALLSLKGLEKINKAFGEVSINQNPRIKNLEGLNGLDTIWQNFYIAGNDSLVSLTGLDNLRYVNLTLGVLENPELKSIAGMKSLEHTRNIAIQHNRNLESLEGLKRLKSLSGNLFLRNLGITTTKGLDSLEHVQFNLAIDINEKLQKIDGFERLKIVNGAIKIVNNIELTAITAFDAVNIDSLDFLEIRNNDKLTACKTEFICNYISEKPDFAGIYFNAGDCLNLDILKIACLVSTNEIDGILKLTISPSLVTDFISITGDDQNSEGFLYQIISVDGKTFKKGSISLGEDVQVSDLSPGMYFLKISRGSDFLTRKFIKL